jgi:hypothetical protein
MDIDTIVAAVHCLDDAGRRRLRELLLELAADQGITPLIRRALDEIDALEEATFRTRRAA